MPLLEAEIKFGLVCSFIARKIVEDHLISCLRPEDGEVEKDRPFVYIAIQGEQSMWAGIQQRISSPFERLLSLSGVVVSRVARQALEEMSGKMKHNSSIGSFMSGLINHGQRPLTKKPFLS